MAANTAGEALQRRANRLYWSGADTVERVAGQLGMSRHALYAAVRPAPAGSSCTECGEPLVYANRTHRAASLATCSGCDLEVQLRDAVGDGSVDQGTREVVFLPDEEEWGAGSMSGMREVVGTLPPRRVAAVAGALTLGALLGAVAVRAAGRYA